MKRITLTYILPFIAAFAAGWICYAALLNSDFVNKKAKFEVEFESEQPSEMQLFLEDDKQFKAENMRSAKTDVVKNGVIDFEFPFVYRPGRLRLDPGFTRGKWLIRKITLKGLSNSICFNAADVFAKFKPANDIKTYRLDPDGVYVESNGPDPNLVSTFGMPEYIDALTATPAIQLFPFLLSCCLAIMVLYVLNKKLRYFLDVKITPSHLLIFVFITVLVLPFAGMTLFSKPNADDSGENRKLTGKPVFNFNKILEYPAAYNHYFDDNFGFRKSLSTFNSYYKLKIFNSSSKPDMVAIGKKSWLFSVDPNLAGDYQHLKLFTDDELKTIRYNLEEAYNWYNEKDIHFFITVLPIKSSIYPEYMPDFMKLKTQNSKLQQLSDYMNKNSFVKIIDVRDELLKRKSVEEVYYEHDFHMNFEGGYIAYTKLLNAMKQYDSLLVPTPAYKFKKVFRHIHNADLSKQLSLEDVLLNDEWLMKRPGKALYKKAEAPVYGSVQPIQPTVHTQIANSKLPKVVVYRDSYFNLLSPFFSENFSDCIYIWTNEMSVEVVEKEKPKFVVYEILESSIDKLLEDNPTGIRKK